MDKPEPHPVYDFFAPGPLPGYAGNPNNNNGWIEKRMHYWRVGRVRRTERWLAQVVGAELPSRKRKGGRNYQYQGTGSEEQVIARVIDMEEDIAMLFGDGNFSDDDSEGFEDEEEVWEVNEEWLMAPVTLPPMPFLPPPSTYEVGGPSTAAAEGQSFTLPAPGFPVPPRSDAEVADGITIGEIGPRVSAVEGQVQVMASQMIQVVGRLEQVGTQVEPGQQAVTQRVEAIEGLTQQVQTLQAAVQQRDVQIQQLQTMVSEISSRESTLMQCILGMDRRLADLERRPPGPQ
ncbi:hypothetical protein Tco_1016811 [Tanacetum coccineum]|uniref:Uncharacterized protein n=1 Tax=Tanacetum coccineum TaxID=301880 RepID=A0ABQ5FPQ2_9ASTR